MGAAGVFFDEFRRCDQLTNCVRDFDSADLEQASCSVFHMIDRKSAVSLLQGIAQDLANSRAQSRRRFSLKAKASCKCIRSRESNAAHVSCQLVGVAPHVRECLFSVGSIDANRAVGSDTV